MTSVSPNATALPSFTHFIFGVGFPVALQWNVAVADSSTVWSAGVVIKLGATETKNIRFQVETTTCGMNCLTTNYKQ